MMILDSNTSPLALESTPPELAIQLGTDAGYITVGTLAVSC